jgi:hypothetical protein
MTKAFASSIGMSSGTITVNVLIIFPTNYRDLTCNWNKGNRPISHNKFRYSWRIFRHDENSPGPAGEAMLNNNGTPCTNGPGKGNVLSCPHYLRCQSFLPISEMANHQSLLFRDSTTDCSPCSAFRLFIAWECSGMMIKQFCDLLSQAVRPGDLLDSLRCTLIDCIDSHCPD